MTTTVEIKPLVLDGKNHDSHEVMRGFSNLGKDELRKIYLAYGTECQIFGIGGSHLK